jgi:4-amino-4-deoxy-L-arabinose transferase-like glycosyltransferase
LSARNDFLIPGLLFIGMFLVLCLLGLGRDLWTPDEPREAGISREMMLTPGVVPTLNGRHFIEKPPLYYWTVAGVFTLFKPSAAAARGVSAAASFLTLALVFLWGRREFSTRVGLIAAFGLATSLQFTISSRWIVIDPMLMLLTTAALWAGAELVRGRGTLLRLITFYVALALAMWTKGLIGPVLVACGLVTYAALRRSLASLRPLRPFTGTAIMLLVAGSIAVAIYADAGEAQVREWLWVNHVQRFVDPEGTGHDQPFYYYLTALPIAVFPWWAPFVSLFGPGTWRGEPGLQSGSGRPDPERQDAKVVLGAACLGMLLLLSASATKRELYLLPMLPPLFLLLAVQADDWWTRHARDRLRGGVWWLQVACVTLFAAAPTVLVLAYLRRFDAAAVVFLALVVGLTTASVVLARRGHGAKAVAAQRALLAEDWGEIGPDAGVDSVGVGPMGYDELNVAASAGNYGWPYFIGYNRGYNRVEYGPPKTFGPPMDPSRSVNRSPNNSGIQELPPARPAMVAYPYGVSEEWPVLGSGGRCAVGVGVDQSQLGTARKRLAQAHARSDAARFRGHGHELDARPDRARRCRHRSPRRRCPWVDD